MSHKYIIKDLQFSDRYFGGDELIKFDSKEEAIRQLIDYHSIDCDMDEEKKLLGEGKIDEAERLICDFEWKIIKIKE